MQGRGSTQVVSLRWMGEAVTLGKAISSNNVGNGPEEDEVGSLGDVCAALRVCVEDAARATSATKNV